MKSVIKTGKTIDEAIQAGLNELGATKEQAEIEILEEPTKGLFGILGGKDAVVRISVEDHFKEELLRDLRLPYVDEKTAKKQEKPVEKPVEKTPDVPKEREEKPVQKEESIEKPVDAPVNPMENVNATDALMQEQQEEVLVDQENDQKDAAPVVEQPQNPLENTNATDALMQEQQEETFVDSHEEIVEEVDITNEPSVLLLKEMIATIDANASYQAHMRNHHLHITVEGQDEESIGLLIGRRGDTLDAMQYLLSVAAHRKNLPYRKVILDINGYRKKREETLIRLAQRSAQKVKKSGRSFRLEPMNPYERRIIHSELQKMDGVHTISEGNEPYRRVVIRANRNE